MRTFLMSIFWVTTIGNVIQLLVIGLTSWLVFSGAYSLFELNVEVFATQVVPWLFWLKAAMVAVLGEFGRWILSIPILIIAPVKFVAGIFIGLWAYSAAQDIAAEPAFS